MTDLRIDEISGVGRAANLTEGWLMLKGIDPATALTLARAEAVAKGLDPSLIKGNDMPVLSDEAFAALPAEAQSYVKSLEDAVLESTPAPSEAEAVAKALETVPEPLRKAFEKAQREAAHANEVTTAIEDREAVAKYTAVAKSLTAVPETTTESMAKALRDVAENAPESYDTVLKALTAAEAIAAKSPLFKEFGSGGVDATDASASDALVAKANELREADSELTFASAMTKAASAHPDLYAQHRAENKQ